jgi:uncharacterized protein
VRADAALLDRLRELKPQLNARGITHLALFGSRARGAARADSDVDLLIDLAPVRFSLIDLVGVEREIADQLGLPVSVVVRRSVEPRMMATIAPDVVELF